MSDPTDFVSLYVTAPTREVAVDLARDLVRDGLVACANVIGGVTSVYRWDGALCEDDEVVMFAKTDRGHVDAARARIVERHPYDVPCVVALPLVGGHPAYLAWVAEQLPDVR